MDVRRGFPTSRNVDVAAARRAAADEHGVEFFSQQRAHRVDAAAAAKLNALVDDVADFFVDYAVGKSKLRNLRAHHAARLGVAVENHAFIAQRRKIARDGQ